MATSKRERQRANREKAQVETVELEEKTEQKKNFTKYGVLAALVLLAIIVYACTAAGGEEEVANLTTGDRATQAELEAWRVDSGSSSPSLRNQIYAQNGAPPMVLDIAKEYEATITTANGDMRFRLFASDARVTVNNFIALAEDGFYDGLTFHLSREDLVQTGDPSGLGTGGPGYSFGGEFNPDKRPDKFGVLAMTPKNNNGVIQPDSAGSQFIITRRPTDLSAVDYAVFGEIIEGEDVLAAISERNPASADSPGDVMESITIQEVTS